MGKKYEVSALILGSLVGGAFASDVQAAVLATYEFTGQTTGQKTAIPATSSGSNVTASDVTRNNVIMDVGNDAAWTSRPYLGASTGSDTAGAPFANAAAAVSANSYFTFTLTADSGYELDLSSLAFVVTKGGGSTRGFAMQTSATGFSTDGSTNINTSTGDVSAGFSQTVTTQRGTPAFTNVNLSLTGAAYQDLDSITFRFFTFAASNFQTVEYDNFTVNGTVSLVPEPASLGLAGVVVIGAFGRRRRRA